MQEKDDFSLCVLSLRTLCGFHVFNFLFFSIFFTSFFKQIFVGEAIHLCASLYNDGYLYSPIARQWHILGGSMRAERESA